MSELRDARLKRALDEAPDASLQPLARTRDAIRAAAHGAVQPAWKRRWSGGGGPRPWHAAFATVLLAGLITLMWQGEELPGARQPAADPPIPAVKAPAPEPAKPQAPPPTQAPVQEEKPAVKDGPVAPAPAAMARKAPAPPAPATPLPEAPPAAAPATAAPRVETAPLAKAQPEPQLESRAEQARQREAPAAGVGQPMAPAPAAPPPPVMAEAPAAAPQAAPRAQADTSSSLRAAAPAPAARRPAAAQTAAWDDWSQVRIRGAQHTLLVERAQAGRLAALIARMVRSEGLVAAARGPATLSLELLQGEQPIGTLETDGAQWRWRPEQAAGPTARDFNADAALAAALRQEAERLLRR